jgi:lipopolysaccharide cholinephosphotransferase
MRQIKDISEAHQILLNIAKEFDKVCKKNDIPYYMLGGTMLGAVRHKGFIPWDDDMDFGVPRPYYDKLVGALERDLPHPYRCNTYKNNPGVTSAILKIDDSRTIADDPRVRLALDKQIGLNIDIFPLDYCNADDEILKTIHQKMHTYQTVYVRNEKRTVWKNAIKILLSAIWPISRVEMLDRIHRKLSEVKAGPILANVFGVWGTREFIPVEWYGEKVLYPFEDTEFYGIKEFDKYLTKLYGDYMTPPKGDKHRHLDSFYWKE